MTSIPRSALDTPELIEIVANVEHERWSHWQRYLHQQCVQGADGSLVIPAELVTRWARQMDTSYAQLSEAEKESDREQAIEYLDALRQYLDAIPGSV